MFYSPNELKNKAEGYCTNHGLKLVAKLGHGMQGLVFATDHESAIKIHYNATAYNRERVVYQRLKQHNAVKVREFIVPALKDFDDNLLVIEMTLVSPPFIVDFGGAYLDAPPAYAADPERKNQWLAERQEQFGEKTLIVSSILSDFERLYGVFVSDVNPGNIRFRK